MTDHRLPTDALGNESPAGVAVKSNELALLCEQANQASGILDGLRARIAHATASVAGSLGDGEVPPPGSPDSGVELIVEANARLVVTLLRCHEDVALAALAVDALALTASLDALTSLPNRTVLMDRLTQALASARRREGRAALLFIDLDRFKNVNDTFGHAAGDEVLKSAANAVVSAVRECDTVSRHGGDEFVVLLPEISHPADAEQVALKVIAALDAAANVGNGRVGIQASIGICIFPDDCNSALALIAGADAAMFRAKKMEHLRVQRAGHFETPAATSGGQTNPDTQDARAELAESVLQEANELLLLAALASREARDHAQAALRDHTDGVAMVVHELRNPLAPIRGAAALMRNAGPQQLAHMQSIIERQVGHLSRLIEDLMDLSRARTGKFHLVLDQVDLAEVLQEAIEMCRPAIDGRKQQLELQLRDAPAHIPGDAARLVQVFSNLLFNAAKYTPEHGAIGLLVSTTSDSVVTTVSDTGIGISAAALPTVFDVFMQEHHAAGYNREGLGIGLTVVRELVEAHGGAVVARSEGVGRGSQFLVTLPRNAREPESPGVVEPERQALLTP